VNVREDDHDDDHDAVVNPCCRWSEAVGTIGLDVEGGVEAAKAIMSTTNSVKLDTNKA
jgi:hypothetical protein